MRQDPWWTKGKCVGLAPMFDAPVGHRQAWSPAEQERLDRAAAICDRCPVQVECLADARLGRDEGVRAGMVLVPLSSVRVERGVA